MTRYLATGLLLAASLFGSGSTLVLATAQRPPTPQNLRDDVRYSVGHQGARIWINDTDNMLQGEKLRAALDSVVMDTSALSAATIPDLEAAAVAGIADCKNFRNIQPDFLWVSQQANGQMKYVFIADLQRGAYDSLRSEFSFREENDDQIRNLIYCRNGSDIQALAQSIGLNIPPPQFSPELVAAKRFRLWGLYGVIAVFVFGFIVGFVVRSKLA